MLPLRSEIIAGAIHKAENILLHRSIDPEILRWKFATTTTILPAIIKY